MSSSDADQKIDEFVAITGGSKDLAKSLLAICNGNLEMAINMHMEGVQTEETTQPGTSNSTSTTASASNSIPDDEGLYPCIFKKDWQHQKVIVYF